MDEILGNQDPPIVTLRSPALRALELTGLNLWAIRQEAAGHADNVK